MKILVTGAGGFLGQAVVQAAAASGHAILAMHRPNSLPRAESMPSGVEILAGDLRQVGPWCDAIGDVDAVVHCAAAFGDLSAQLAGTVLATENLLTALPAKLKRIVHVSSFSVYDFNAPGWLGTLDEQTPLEPDPLRRDPYTQTKMIQEQMIRDYASKKAIALVVARPGAIYGPGKDWDCGRGLGVGRFGLIFAPGSAMRLIHVNNCADALVAALTAPVGAPLTINLVDDEQPSHWRFHRMARRAGVTKSLPIPVPYFAVLFLGLSAWIASRLFFKGSAKLPEMLDLPRQRVRWRPLRYPNLHSKQALGWHQQLTLDEGVKTLTQLPKLSNDHHERVT
jgi:2-alkyl-3-oxoalkanoate reductase